MVEMVLLRTKEITRKWIVWKLAFLALESKRTLVRYNY